VRLAAIETATAVTAVAVGENGDVTEVLADDRRRHTEALAPGLVSLLDARGWTLDELDVVVVDVGPGLFTGLRVGVATAKGINVATGVGLLGVLSTDVLARSACEAGIEGAVIAVVDVRRGEVVAARYRCGPSGATSLEGAHLIGPDVLATALRGLGKPLVAVGDGATRYRDVLGAVAEVRDDLVVPSPAAAIRLARQRLASGEPLVDHDGVHPWYAREADAVANFAVRTTRT
jgi:tRNA threonylcarbamoyladenosine biosynthesis protein TsaB